MPPKKKARKSAAPSTQVAEPLVHISQARENAGKRFKLKKKRGVNYDVEQNVREIRAILATNAEIFDRCMGSMGERKGNQYHVKFKWVGFGLVRAIQSGNYIQFVTSHGENGDTIEMKALMKLPDGLDGTIVHKYMAEPFSMYIDYGAFFEKSLLLDNEVLEPFLAKLKEHLMSIQVCLGEVETCVMEPLRDIDFLKGIFGVELDLPDDNSLKANPCSCPSGVHGILDGCMNCTKTFKGHKYPVGTQHYSQVQQCTSFHCSGYNVLKQIYCVAGRHEHRFDIGDEGERLRLKTFLDFLEI